MYDQKHNDVADKADHTFDAGVVTTPATETSEGVLTLTCTVCGFQKTKPIDKLEHVHTFDMTKWSYDNDKHWHPATCAHTDEKKDLAAHNWNAGEITKPADYGVAGEKPSLAQRVLQQERKQPPQPRQSTIRSRLTAVWNLAKPTTERLSC